MQIELNPGQKNILDRAAASGMSPEDVLNQAFAIIEDQLESEGWMLRDREAVAAHIAAGFEQAKEGKLIDGEEVIRLLRERRATRHIA